MESQNRDHDHRKCLESQSRRRVDAIIMLPELVLGFGSIAIICVLHGATVLREQETRSKAVGKDVTHKYTASAQ